MAESSRSLPSSRRYRGVDENGLSRGIANVDVRGATRYKALINGEMVYVPPALARTLKRTGDNDFLETK